MSFKGTHLKYLKIIFCINYHLDMALVKTHCPWFVASPYINCFVFIVVIYIFSKYDKWLSDCSNDFKRAHYL